MRGRLRGRCATLPPLRVAQTARNATIAFIVCDRGDRYLSTGLFNEQAEA